MSEARVIGDTQFPVTRGQLVADLAHLGVSEGDLILVHSSLSRIGWVVGGARTVIEALAGAIGATGTLVMPAFSGDLSDPAEWGCPAVPAEWVETIRENMAGFDRARTPTRAMGRIAEEFRTWPGTLRSDHPTCSMAALGPLAAQITAEQPADFPLGMDGPMGKIYALQGKILLLGAEHASNSSLHLAESRATFGRRICVTWPFAEGSRVVWKNCQDVHDDEGVLFPQIGADFEATGGVEIGKVGQAHAKLMDQRSLVDFAAEWLDARLGETNRPEAN